LIAFLFIAGSLLAADKEVNAQVVKVDVKKKLLIVKIDDDKKEYNVNGDTKFVGARGGVSDNGLNDDRLSPGAEVRGSRSASRSPSRFRRIPQLRERDRER
jgi:hypothetical protein